MPHRKTALFDLDGTLVDSDAALIAPFHALGIDPDRIPPLGLPAGEACTYAGITRPRPAGVTGAAATGPRRRRPCSRAR